MWSFRKKNKQTDNQSVSASRQPMWLIWLLSIVTFIVTVLIVLGLFWLGRWALQRVKNDDKSRPQTVQEQKDNTDAQPGVNNDREEDRTGVNNTPPAPTTPSTPATPPPTTPNTGETPAPTPTTLFNTGPSSDE